MADQIASWLKALGGFILDMAEALPGLVERYFLTPGLYCVQLLGAGEELTPWQFIVAGGISCFAWLIALRFTWKSLLAVLRSIPLIRFFIGTGTPSQSAKQKQ